MTLPEGGLRDRLIRTALHVLVLDIVEAVGWRDPGRKHAPVNVVATAYDTSELIAPNTIGVWLDDVDYEDGELGSNASIDTLSGVIDIFGESDSFSKEISGDISAGLRGRFPSIGRDRAVLEVFDTMATPQLLDVCDIENVHIREAHDFPQEWLRHWRSITLDIVIGDFG